MNIPIADTQNIINNFVGKDDEFARNGYTSKHVT